MITRYDKIQFREYFEKLLVYYKDDDRVSRQIYNRHLNRGQQLHLKLARWHRNLLDIDIILSRIGNTYLADYKNEMDWLHIADFIILIVELQAYYPKLEDKINNVAFRYIENYAMEWIFLKGGWIAFPDILEIEKRRLVTSILTGLIIGGISSMALRYFFINN